MSGSYGSSWTRLDSTAALMSRSESSIRGHYRGCAGRVASEGLVARDGAGGTPPGDLSHRQACMGGAAGIWQVNMIIQTELPWPEIGRASCRERVEVWVGTSAWTHAAT